MGSNAVLWWCIILHLCISCINKPKRMRNGKDLLLEMFSLLYLLVAIFSSQSVFLNPALRDWSDEASCTSLQTALVKYNAQQCSIFFMKLWLYLGFYVNSVNLIYNLLFGRTPHYSGKIYTINISSGLC